MADIGPFMSVPLILEDPATGNRTPIGRAVLDARTYRVLNAKVFAAGAQLTEGWRKELGLPLI